MSNGFIFCTDPLKLTTPLIVPAVAESTEIVAGLAAEEAEDGSESDCGLLQPESRVSEISVEQKKILPRINADERGSEECKKLTIQAIRFLWSPEYPKVVALSA
jgi:hypothetical protein